ncbi:MAG: hypothetical protein MI725_08420 [Pirellulales bacterium]|nr:hypothetical protein [Pirellulales bacterium]
MPIVPWLIAEADRWKSEFFGLDQDQRFVLLLVAIGCATAVLIAITAIGAGVYNSVKRRRQDMELKQEMLDRGMSAEEIAEVIKATPVEDYVSRWIECKKD